MNWSEYFLKMAQLVATKSKDKHTQIGAVLVGVDNQVISTGYNSFVRGLNDNISERKERPEKYFWYEHAERNSLYNAALSGVSTKNSKIYLSCDIPCIDCARGLINSGVKEIHCIKGEGTKSEHWQEGFKRSSIMFKECKVKVFYYHPDNLTTPIEIH